MRIEGQLRQKEDISGFIPITNAKQTTEVFMDNNKLKMRITRKSISAEEIVGSL